MVVNLFANSILKAEAFESSVISYGSESEKSVRSLQDMFESSVISYGSESFCL